MHSIPSPPNPRLDKTFIMETNTSGFALGVVIAQEFEDRVHPIAYHARSLAPAERNYDMHDKELARVIYGPMGSNAATHSS
jgi:hypothetical protein